MEKQYYLAYGSNLNLPQMRYRCPTAAVIGTAVIEDYELLFKGSHSGSYLTIEPKVGASVPVAVWSVTERDQLRLDRYEGYPNSYYKQELMLPVKDINTGKVKKRECFVYIMHEDRPIGAPTAEYLETCLEGYDAFHFDSTPLMNAFFAAEEECRHENNY